MSKSFHTQSYQKHKEHFKNLDAGARLKLLLDENTADFWRQKQKLDTLKPILEDKPKAKWLTIGDGGFGLDSIELKKRQESITVFPTDISPYLLEYAKEKGIIDSYGIENAEKISFEDNSFEYVFCKEAFHHFPRPMIAFYEMLRVAKEGVVMIEPNDWKPAPSLLFIKNSIFKFINKLQGKSYHADSDAQSFEASGNYIYSISIREMEKAALALNLSQIAFKTYHDYYIPRQDIQDETKRLKKIKKNIGLLNLLTKFKMKNYNLITMVVFKKKIDTELRQALTKEGFQILDLPPNPYI
jgi:ubiquinone/menaquinone biosynthesis C-methylase UbiE